MPEVEERQGGSSAMRAVRQQLKVEKDLRKKAEAEAATLRQALDVTVDSISETVVRNSVIQAGLKGDAVKEYTDILMSRGIRSEAGALEYLVKLGVVQEVDEDLPPVRQSVGFVPVSGDSHMAPHNTDRVSYEVFKGLLSSDPQRAERLFREKKVDGLEGTAAYDAQ